MKLEDLLLLLVKLQAISHAIKDGDTVPFHVSHRHGDTEDVIEGTFQRKKITPK